MAWSKGSRTPWKRLVAAWAPRGIRRSGGARSSASCELGVGWHEAALDQMPRAPARPCWSRSVGAQVIERGVAGSARPGHVGGCAAGLRGREFQQLDAGRPTVRAPRAHPLGLTPRAFHVAVLWARTMVTGAGRSSSWAWGGTGRPAGRTVLPTGRSLPPRQPSDAYRPVPAQRGGEEEEALRTGPSGPRLRLGTHAVGSRDGRSLRGSSSSGRPVTLLESSMLGFLGSVAWPGAPPDAPSCAGRACWEWHEWRSRDWWARAVDSSRATW